LPGVQDVQVDLATDRFTVVFIANDVSVDQMHNAVKSLGYVPKTVSSEIGATDQPASGEAPEPVRSALAKAQADGKLLFLDFQAKWCGACKIMERTTFADENVKETFKNYVFLKVDADSDAVATKHYRVAGLPTLVVMNGSGDEVYRHVGPITAPDLNLALTGLSNNQNLE